MDKPLKYKAIINRRYSVENYIRTLRKYNISEEEINSVLEEGMLYRYKDVKKAIQEYEEILKSKINEWENFIEKLYQKHGQEFQAWYDNKKIYEDLLDKHREIFGGFENE